MRLVVLTCVVLTLRCSHAVAADEGTDGTLRGIVQAVHEASISTDLFVPIARLPFREGQSFEKGDVLAAFDCRDLEAEMKAADARRRGEQLTYDNNRRLAKLNAAGEYDVELQGAKLDQAKAEVDSLKLKIGRCVIQAPFKGRIADLFVNEHEFPDRQRPLMRIVDQSSLEIDLLLPAEWMQWLKPGQAFDILIEETGLTYRAQVTTTSPVVDPVSQTIKIMARFIDGDADVLPGMSGPAKFEVPQ